MRRKDEVGRWGEEVAARHLKRSGLVVLERNWSCRSGELDIVARDGNVLVVCEVKTRTSAEYGSPLEAVTPEKAARLGRLAAEWLAARGVHADGVRIDVVGVLGSPGTPPRLEHLRGVD
jgi:putative endonuclease